MSHCSPRLHRRSLLAGIGAVALTLPFLRRTSSAAEAPAPKRFVVFYTPNEPIDKAHWDPKVASGSTLPTALPTVFEPLAAHKSHLVMIGDLTNRVAPKSPEGGGHQAIGHMLTGRINEKFGADKNDFWATGISVDQHIAAEWGVDALTLGALPGNGSNGYSRISYLGKNQPVHPYEDPRVAFDKIFGSPDLSEAEKNARRLQQKKVLEAAALEVSRVKNRLPQVDRHKLELHLDAVLGLQQKLDAVAQSCTPTPLDPTGSYKHNQNAHLPETTRLHIDVLVQALACGTRVGSLQIGNSGGAGITPVWPGDGIDISRDAHNISHDYNGNKTGTAKANREKLETWYTKQFAYLLERMKATEEGDGTTLLDNTLVLWCKAFARDHNDDPMFYMLAGGASGALQTNRYWSFPGRPHNDLLTSVCQLSGLDDQLFGDPDFCTGALKLS